MQTYQGNLIARPESELRSAKGVMELALFCRKLGMSGECTYQVIEEEIYAYHEGDLFSMKEDWLDPDNLRPLQLWPQYVLKRSRTLQTMRADLWGGLPWEEIRFEMGDLFGADRRGTMNKLMRLATFPPECAVAAHLAPRFMFIDFSKRIRAGRLGAKLI